jgi:PTS system mannose-specific IIA component
VIVNEPTGIIVTHGGLAQELLDTAELVVGAIPFCYAISNKDLTDEALLSKIKKIIERTDPSFIFLFTDYFGSSCALNCVRAVRHRKDAVVISGVNLPIILDFVTKRGTMKPEEIISNLILRGRESVKIIDI